MEEKKGHYHPLTLAVRDIERIFREIGFSIVLGPEMEKEWYNFDALNVPKDHPARDMQDTFWVKDKEEVVMRTHTSNVQIRYMEEHKNDFPIKIIAPGRVYRNEATDATHEAVFHQIEGLWVDKNVTVADFKGVMKYFFSEFYGKEVKTRFRPSFFPFVEPGFEIDMSCVWCEGKNKSCPVCKGTGWIEVVPGGVVHPNVLSNVGINPREYQGFAFGAGWERLVMLKYGIDDIRTFMSGDLRVVNQF